MKRLYSIMLLVLFACAITAQVSKTINIYTPGTLNTLLTATEKTTVTNLTITGWIDAQDFATMRDAMSVLSVLDISAVRISTYTGFDGTGDIGQRYPNNELPTFSFYKSNSGNAKSILKNIILPSSLTSIGISAFYNCSSLTSITIPASVTSIGNKAFQNCIGLITVNYNATSCTTYTNPVFLNCTELSNLNIGNNVTIIPSYIFSGCSGLTNVVIPNSVIEIGSCSFYNCSGLLFVTIPNSVNSIGSSCFYGCSNLTNVTIPNSVSSIGDLAFSYCNGLNSLIVDTSNSNYSSLDNVIYNKSKTTLISCAGGKKGAFIIPSSVTSIGDYSFEGCININIVSIPNSVTSIGSRGFNGCIGLTSINIPNSIMTINNSAFSNCIVLTSIEIPNSVTTIKNSVFSGCTGLTSIIIPNSITTINGQAFYNCKGLLNVTIPSLVTSIGGGVFFNCTGLTSITIPSLVTSIGPDAFTGCIGLTKIYARTTTPISIQSTPAVFVGINFASCNLYVPPESLSKYKSASGWKDFINIYSLTPTISTIALSNITTTTINTGGIITDSCGTKVTARGVCWSTSSNPTITNNKTSDGTGIGTFTNIITGLEPSTTYHIRSYAINNDGISYGIDLAVQTAGIPIVETTLISSIGAGNVKFDGNVTYDGKSLVSERGFCWNTLENPTITDNKITLGIGTGLFSTFINNLKSSTLYHIRAYAINSYGISYGADSTFITKPAVLSNVYLVIVQPYSTTARIVYGINANSGTDVTARGVCWSIMSNPTIANNKTTDVIGTGGSYDNLITGLNPSTVYHIRAYATNIVGTSYSSDYTFATFDIPTISTISISSVKALIASSGGNITSDGGATVTSRGICWSTYVYPTIVDYKTSDGTGNGSFVSSMTGLTPFTTYYVRAYAINMLGTFYGSVVTFTTSKLESPTIATTLYSDITNTTVTAGGNVTAQGTYSVTVRGVCWSTSTNPTIADSKTDEGMGSGIFTSSITGLIPGFTYHVRAYATNDVGTSYGTDITFKTLDVPTISIYNIGIYDALTARIIGNVTSDGGSSVTSRGVCWSSIANPTIADNKTSDGTGIGYFQRYITGLTPVTTYHVRAYAKNNFGTSYSSDSTFVTSAAILSTVVTWWRYNDITNSTLTASGNVTNEGTYGVTAKGVCWSTSYNPTIADSKTNDGIGSGIFSSNITGLISGVTYHVRAYATSNAGTSYGSDDTYTTLGTAPTITTSSPTKISGTYAIVGGNVTNIGTSSVTARGVCWSGAINPTISDNKTIESSGSGKFTSSITGLYSGMAYHARAYATNSIGTTYGNEIVFTTLANSTEVSANNIAFISSTQDATLTNMPTTMTMNSNNPYNFINPGNFVRFKVQFINKKTNGTNIVSGLCKVRSIDPNLLITDSTSGLNNVAWNGTAWSTEEFEIQIKSTTPLGYVAYVDFFAVEGSNNYFTYRVPILIAPLSLQSKTVDDDNNPDSKGNSNGICEPNEIIETLPTLQNISTFSANNVSGIFNNYYNVSGINVWNNKQGSSGTVVNNSYWNYSFNTPQEITAGAKNMLPQWDFVFDYNSTKTYHFTMGLSMSGTFKLLSGYNTYIKWLIPIEYNVGYSDISTGVVKTFIENLNVYPNPSNGLFTLNIGGDFGNNCTVSLTNALGQKVYVSKLATGKLNIDLSHYNFKGIYFLQLLNEKGLLLGEKKVVFK